MSDFSRGTVWKFEARCSVPNRISRSQITEEKKKRMNHSWKRRVEYIFGHLLAIRKVCFHHIYHYVPKYLASCIIPHRLSDTSKKRMFLIVLIVFALAFATPPKSTQSSAKLLIESLGHVIYYSVNIHLSSNCGTWNAPVQSATVRKIPMLKCSACAFRVPTAEWFILIFDMSLYVTERGWGSIHNIDMCHYRSWGGLWPRNSPRKWST